MKLINADELLNVFLKIEEDKINVKDVISIINMRNKIIDIPNIIEDINLEIRLNRENEEYVEGLEYSKKAIINNTYREIHKDCSWCQEDEINTDLDDIDFDNDFC